MSRLQATQQLQVVMINIIKTIELWADKIFICDAGCMHLNILICKLPDRLQYGQLIFENIQLIFLMTFFSETEI